MWDLTGTVPLHLDANEVDFMHAMVKVALCEKTAVQSVLADALLMLRNHLVSAMTTGSCMLLNMGMLSPDFH